MPTAPRQQEFHRISIRAPLAMLLRLDDHLGDLQRELALIRLGQDLDGDDAPPTAASGSMRLLTRLERALHDHAPIRDAIRDQAHRARAHGQTEVEVVLRLTPQACGTVQALGDLLEAAHGIAHRRALLAVSADPQLRAFTRRWTDEIVDQLSSIQTKPSPGREPAAAPPSVPVPPPVLRTVTLLVTSHVGPTTPGAARRALRETLATWELHDLRDTAELLLGELVANSLFHAGGSIEVLASAAHDLLRVEILDDSPVLPRLRGGTETMTGRGLGLVGALASRWGAEHTAGGKRVWFELEHTPGRRGR